MTPHPVEGLALAETQAQVLLQPVLALPRELHPVAMRARFPLFAARMLRVRPKEGGQTWPFLLNPIQADYLKGLRANYSAVPGVDLFRGIRDLIVKPRQLGFSTEVAGLFLADGFMNPGRTSVIVTHDQKISEELLLTYRTFWDGIPEPMKKGMRLIADSKYSLAIAFPKQGSSEPIPSRFLIATEAGHDWRGGKIDNLHASEAAFYSDYQAFKNSFLQAVPATGNAILETTANGQNLYYRDVMAALEHAGEPSMPWRVVFYEWFRHPEYRSHWDPKRQPPLTPDESALMGTHDLDLRQIAWRRSMIAVIGESFPQEYPESLAGAFLSTGRPFFDQQAVSARLEALRLAPRAARQESGGITIWDDPEPGGVYLLSADTAEGIERGKVNPFDPEAGGADFCAAYVIEARSLRVVAAIHARMDPPNFARMLSQLGRRYRAVIAPERNNHGHTVLHALEQAFYPAVYRHLEYDEGSGKRFLAPGFPTTSKTRPQMLDALADSVRQGALICPDQRFWLEAHRFHRNPRGKPEAIEGAHDDRVMALAIGVYLCTLGRGAWGLDGTDAAESFGFAVPAAGAPAHVPLPPPPGPVTGPVVAPDPGDHPDRAFSPASPGGANIWTELAVAREALRPTCGNCLHFLDGRCSVHRFQVRAADVGCETHYPADAGEYPDPFSGQF